MIVERPGRERGTGDHGWLLARYTFSFADYRDPDWMGFRGLRVLNEDRVQPGRGFGTHPHADMEILTYLLDGALEHRDSTGHTGVLRPGDVQVMSAGTGVTHSEVNHSPDEELHLMQIWLLPDRSGHEPRYDERHYSTEERSGGLRLIASGSARQDALFMHCDARVYASLLPAGETLDHEFDPGRHGWLQVARGRVRLGERELAAGDAVAISDEPRIGLSAAEDAELLLFDLA